MNQDRFWELVSLKLSGEATADELNELEVLLKEYPNEGLRLETLSAIWDTPCQDTVLPRKAGFNRHMQRLSNHLSDPVLKYEDVEDESESEITARVSPYRRILWLSGVAAALIAAFFIFRAFDAPATIVKGSSAQNTVSTKRGSKSKVQLPDGTEVWLNSDSRITYNENFQGLVREVQLTGEAFFDVAHDEKRPFVIHTAAIDLKVLGTAFNVRSYSDEKNTETSLIRGSVEVTLLKSPDQKKIILKPKDKLIVNNDQATLVEKEDLKVKSRIPLMTLAKIRYQEQDTAAMEILWVKNKLVFDGEPLEEVARRIERWYDVEVNIPDERVKRIEFSATFVDEDLQTVLEALRYTGLKCSMNKREVTLRQ